MNYTDDGLLRHAKEELSLALIALVEGDPRRDVGERLGRLHAEILAHHAAEDAYHTEQEALAATWESDDGDEMHCPAAGGIPCGADDCLANGCVEERP